MKEYMVKDIRNIAVLGHGSEGKTTLVEAMLYAAGVIDRQGRVEDGNTVSDYDPEEIKRHNSISASVAPIEIHNKKLNIIDVPGYFDFAGEMAGPLAAVEGAVIVMSASTGLSTGFEKAWDATGKQHVARMIVVSQVDRENINYRKVLDDLRAKYGSCIIPTVLPIGEGTSFKGVVDVLSRKAFTGAGKDRKEIAIPAEMEALVQEAIEACYEAAASTSEELMEKFFDEGELSDTDMMIGLSAGIYDGSIVPVVPVSSINGIGIRPLMYELATYMPSPMEHTYHGINPKTKTMHIRHADMSESFTAQVFKTIADPFVGKLSLVRVISGVLTPATALYNPNKDKPEKAAGLFMLRGKKQIPVSMLCAGDIGALSKLQYTATGDSLSEIGKVVQYEDIAFPAPQMSLAVYAKKAGEEDKVFSGLARLCEEMPDVIVAKDPMTTETLISGQGELQLEIVRQKLQAKFGANADFREPKIAYRESIRKTISVQGRHKKQSGGHGQFGDIWVEFSPAEEGVEFEFVDAVVGGAVPRNFIPSVEKGLRDNLVKGVLAGFPMTGLRAKLYDGSYHPVDSSEMAFKTAARIAYKQCINASPVLLEPIMSVEITVPDEYMGDIMGDMNKRRGRIMGMDPIDGKQVIKAEVPQGEMFKYATDLRSMTQAKGSFKMAFERYEEVPQMIAAKIIEAHKADLEDDEE
ncbi:MAG: elongation factor G [Clostridia bacterium]|nr:elongation factor G [Clostridia bacterium]